MTLVELCDKKVTHYITLRLIFYKRDSSLPILVVIYIYLLRPNTNCSSYNRNL